MCGIIFAASNLDVEPFINAGNEIQKHRGPDSQNTLLGSQGSCNLGFAHQRLAIVDLSSNGQQPMVSASGRYVIVFNGEIYNFRELKQQYGLKNLRSDSDTEIALELIVKLGFEEALKTFNGMWAIVLWDKKTGKILLSRDRFGKKPLVYMQTATGIYVASEVKTFFALPDFEPKPNVKVSARFLTQMVQNSDCDTWVDGVQNLPAATIGEIDTENLSSGIQNIRPFWKPEFKPYSPNRSDSDLLDELYDLVTSATSQRLHADVPVGIALSGGIDSSILAAIAAAKQRNGGPEAVLFSVVHPGQKDDESAFVDRMSDHLNLGVKKVSLNIAEDGPDAAYKLIEQCNHQNDGPLSSLSSVLFYKLMETAKDFGVTVALTGQGADEAFCGYRKFPALEIKHRIKTGKFLSAGKFLGGFLANGTLLPQLNLAEAKRYLGAKNISVLGQSTAEAFCPEAISDVANGITGRQWLDIERYSVPYLCHYEDRMSMSWSREVRSPFLDFRVVEHGLRLPNHLKMQNGWTKFALRKAFSEELPPEITWRKDKKGFVNPETRWFRNELKSHVEEFMGDRENLIYQYGLVKREAYMKMYRTFCRGSPNVWFRDIFAPFSLALWLHRWQSESQNYKIS